MPLATSCTFATVASQMALKRVDAGNLQRKEGVRGVFHQFSAMLAPVTKPTHPVLMMVGRMATQLPTLCRHCRERRKAARVQKTTLSVVWLTAQGLLVFRSGTGTTAGAGAVGTGVDCRRSSSRISASAPTELLDSVRNNSS
jgi:hypothetical protein